MTRLAATLLAVTLVAAGCADDAGRAENEGAAVSPTAAPSGVSVPSTTAARLDENDSESVDAPLAISPLAGLIEPVDDGLVPLDELPAEVGPTPIGLTIPDLGIGDVDIQDVGVEPNGEMEIPGASEVGWYRWSASPGAEGSSVLAAHVAFDGRDGVFRNLGSLAVGGRFIVNYDDGSQQEFEVTEQAQYGKQELPFDRVFDKDGEPEVVLITCGGDFNRGLSSYDDNIVAYASPVA